MSQTKLILVDDHQLVLDGLRSIIESQDDLEILAEAKHGKEALSLLEVLNPDMLLLDVDMPVLDGLQLLEELRQKDTAIQVIMLSMHAEKGIIERALKLGANGFVLKSAGKEELLHAISLIRTGEEYFSPQIMKNMLVKKMPTDHKNIIEKLTPREREIVNKIIAGKHTKEIAAEMQISPRTVEAHKANIMKKLGVHHVAELIHVVSASLNK